MVMELEYRARNTMNDPALFLLKDAERYLLTIEEAAAALHTTRHEVAELIQTGILHQLFFKRQTYLASYEVELYKMAKQGRTPMLQTKDNMFQGINPHLMSFLQTPGAGATTSTYPSFHQGHITHIRDFLNEYLPSQYIALNEASLQIQGREAIGEPFAKDSRPSPDVAIYQSQRPTQEMMPGVTATPTLQAEIQLEELRELASIAIYELKAANHETHGTPITRIELLSPANMRGGSYDEVYQQNRTKCFLAGTTLVEIDYLHEYASPVRGVPHYPAQDHAKAYNITVSHPQTKKVDIYLFGINESIPTVMIPLAGDDFINFNFGEPYDYTWKKSRFWFYVDYSQEPLRMHTYSPADQQLIRQHMQAIAQLPRQDEP